ncbi:hypothetical protein [Haloferula sp. BvORR071]|uniref:hypothetical protein n=1 Tax=Haloferula sp. BvORR071 TaxID=1396141 RepID=UPI00069860B1|nr:hypothetical protein [Haloferula sp. BvORR071]
MMPKVLDSFTNRQLQVYAAVCLKIFCEEMAIRHESIDRFIAHRVRLASSEFLPDWGEEGMALELTGLGDDFPISLMHSIPVGVREVFRQMVENCSEVGYCDMYGADTGDPRKYAGECLRLLLAMSIAAPPTSPLEFDNRSGKRGDDAWGDPFTAEKLAGVTEFYSLRQGLVEG